MKVRALTLAAGAAVLAGCAKPVPPTWVTPASPPVFPDAIYPAEVDYQLLGLVEGRACMEEEELERYAAEAVPTEAGSGHPAVVQAARYDALTKVADADSLTSIRSRVSWEGSKQCVDVTGRAYRVTAIRSVAGAAPTPGLTALVTVTAPGTPAAPTAARAVAGVAPGKMRSRGVVTLSVPSDTRGMTFTTGWTKQFGHVGLEVGCQADTEGEIISPMAGILGGVSYGRAYTYGAARLGYSLGDSDGAILEMAVGNDLLWEHWGARVETAMALSLEGNSPQFRVSAGPTFHY